MADRTLALIVLFGTLSFSAVAAGRQQGYPGIRSEPLPGPMGRYLRLLHFDGEPLRVTMLENRRDDDHWLEGLVVEVENTTKKPVAEAEYYLHLVEPNGDDHHVLRLWFGRPRGGGDAEAATVAEELAPGSRATLYVRRGEELTGRSELFIRPGTVGVLVPIDVRFADGTLWHQRAYRAAFISEAR